MKTLFILYLLLFASLCKAQMLGKYEIEIEGTYNPSLPVYEKWLHEEEGKWPTMKFKKNPVGLKHALEEVDRILADNDMSDADPAFDKSFQGSDIVDDENPEELHKSIMNGNSEVRIGYLFSSNILLQIFLTSDEYELNILGIK